METEREGQLTLRTHLILSHSSLLPFKGETFTEMEKVEFQIVFYDVVALDNMRELLLQTMHTRVVSAGAVPSKQQLGDRQLGSDSLAAAWRSWLLIGCHKVT